MILEEGYGGEQWGFIFIDEAQQFDQQELQWISTACRWTNRDIGAEEETLP